MGEKCEREEYLCLPLPPNNSWIEGCDDRCPNPSVGPCECTSGDLFEQPLTDAALLSKSPNPTRCRQGVELGWKNFWCPSIERIGRIWPTFSRSKSWSQPAKRARSASIHKIMYCKYQIMNLLTEKLILVMHSPGGFKTSYMVIFDPACLPSGIELLNKIS